MSKEAFLAEVEAAIEKIGISPSQFGKDALGDRSFVFDLREGRNVGLDTAERVREFIAKQVTN